MFLLNNTYTIGILVLAVSIVVVVMVFKPSLKGTYFKNYLPLGSPDYKK